MNQEVFPNKVKLSDLSYQIVSTSTLHRQPSFTLRYTMPPKKDTKFGSKMVLMKPVRRKENQ